MNIGKNLTTLRKNRDLSRQELADKIGISVHTYIKYENGSVKPPYETLCKLADYYKVKTDQILGREEIPEPSYNENFESELIEQYKQLPKDVRATILQAILNAAQKCYQQESSTQPTTQDQATQEAFDNAEQLTGEAQRVYTTAQEELTQPTMQEATNDIKQITNEAQQVKTAAQEESTQQTMQEQDSPEEEQSLKPEPTIQQEESEMHIKRNVMMRKDIKKKASRNGEKPFVRVLTEEQKDEIRSRSRADENM